MNMRLLCIFAAILAFSLAEESKEHLKDLVAEETVASAYNTYVTPTQRPWNPPQNYVPQNTWPQDPQQNPVNYITSSPPLNEYVAPQSYGYWPPQNTWKPPHHPHPHPIPVTTPTTVIKNEQYFGNNGDYKYEYQYSDGTHVGENGYQNGPKDEDIVKQGWYSYPDANGKIYTVKWWADYTGFHAYGDHLPTAPPVPKAIQKALDDSAKIGDEKPQTYYNNLNPTQHVQNQNYPSYPQKPVEYQPQQTYATYQ